MAPWSWVDYCNSVVMAIVNLGYGSAEVFPNVDSRVLRCRCWVMLGDIQRYRFGKEAVLRKDRDIGKRGDRGAVVAVQYVVIRNWSEVLRRRVMWHGFVDKEWCWRCVRSQVDIWMVHRGMRNCSMVVDKLYIKKGCCMLDDFLFFSLYKFSCIAKQVTTLKQLR